jgi:DNA-binding HxlR family transcriptional regulator
MRRSSALRVDVPCPIGRAIDVLGDRWTLLILRNATMGVTRFENLRADLGIPDNILSNRLARLVDCADCGRAVERAEIAWIRPWRSPDPLPLAEPA